MTITESPKERPEILYCCLSCKACGKPVNVDTSELCAQCEVAAYKCLPSAFQPELFLKTNAKRVEKSLSSSPEDDLKWTTQSLLEAMYPSILGTATTNTLQ